MTWARLARSRCSDCGAAVLWTTAIDLPWRVRAAPVVVQVPESDALIERKRMWDAINWCGPDAEAWFCADCGGWGVFSDQERRL